MVGLKSLNEASNTTFLTTMLEVEYVPAQTGLELIDFSSMYQVLPLRDLRLLVFALQHIGFNLPIRISEIARCWICHRDIQLASIILHNSLQLSAVIEHVLRIITSPCIGVEYGLQTRATREHFSHIRHRRGIEIRNIEFCQSRAIIEHSAHIRHRRGIEIRNIEFFQTIAIIEHLTHIRHLRGVEVGKVQRRQTRATREHNTHIRHRGGIEIRNIEFLQTIATREHPLHLRHRGGVEVRKI